MTTQITVHIEGGNISVDGIPPEWSDSDVKQSLLDLVATTENAAILTAARAVLVTPCVDLMARYEACARVHGNALLYLDQ